jgi:hypothetical protein
MIVAVADFNDNELHPAALLEATKYLVVDDNTGVVNDVPVANTAPVVDESANQFKVVFAGAVALNVTAFAPQLEPLTVTATADGNALYVAITAVRVADKQPPEIPLAPA